MFFLSSDAWQFKLLVVGLCIAACYKLRYDRLIWVAVGTLLSLVLAEIYWFVTDYETPMVYWHLVILFQTLIVRHFIFFRPTIMAKMFPEWRGIRWIYTDLQIYQLMSVYVVIELMRLAEYYIRHILGFSDVVVVYTLYPYAVQIIACVVIWIVLNEAIRITKERYFVA